MRLTYLILLSMAFTHAVQAVEPTPVVTTKSAGYAHQAAEVTDYIQQTFLDPKSGVYLKARSNQRPDWVWLQSVMFANLIAASRADHDRYAPLLENYFKALDIYWDAKSPIPGYEPAPTSGNGHDKYYDDNAWFVIALAEAYRDTMMIVISNAPKRPCVLCSAVGTMNWVAAFGGMNCIRMERRTHARMVLPQWVV